MLWMCFSFKQVRSCSQWAWSVWLRSPPLRHHHGLKPDSNPCLGLSRHSPDQCLAVACLNSCHLLAFSISPELGNSSAKSQKSICWSSLQVNSISCFNIFPLCLVRKKSNSHIFLYHIGNPVTNYCNWYGKWNRWKCKSV